ncbi:protein kinase [Mycobacterium sp. NPDC051804]|uniref:serine/threonine-protein kinase n=1 Tax=Mycobacterium sp. NPDC051804 TaxID=3364295 RepID=UPI00379F2526
MEGTPFGRYRLVELIGRGGMGEVWKAFDTATRRVVAVKVLPRQLAADPVFEERFRHEAFAAAGLNNPHVVPIHNFGEIEGRLYVDMRLIEGQDLEHVLNAGPMEPVRAVKIIEQIASALNAAHKIGLVHRDVKPSNILVAEDDFSYLIDFGIARAAGETKLTATGNVVGTWPYMAPERFTTGQSDTRSDIYALTCVLYECLTSSRPFPGESVEQQIAGHLTTPPPRPSIKRKDVSPELDAVIAAGMAKDPEDRYPTTTEMARAALAAVANGGRKQATKPGSRKTAPGVAPIAPTQAFQDEDTEKHWHKETKARRTENVQPAADPTQAQPAADPTQAQPAADPTQARPVEQTSPPQWAPTQSGTPEHVEKAWAPTTAQPAQPGWAPTQAGTPDHVEKAWAPTHLGTPAPDAESAAAPTQMQPAQASPDAPAPPRGTDDDAPWPWYKRTAIVVPIALVMIVGAVATILLVLGGDEEAAPGGGAPPPPGAGPNGTFSATFGAPTQPNGQPFQNASGGDENWVIKSACEGGDGACVASATKVDGSVTTATALVLDQVDGRWEAVNTKEGKCGGDASTEVWETMSLQSQPDGSLKGEFIVRSTDPNCASNRPVTFTRTGDAEGGVSVVDPATLPARVVSPAQGLYGRYQEVDTYKDGNRSADVSFDISTYCLRTGDRCLSYWANPGDAKILTFAKNQFVLANRVSDSTCEKGGPAHREITLQYPVPTPAQDPITLLTGNGHYTITGACPFNSDFDSRVERTGD